MTTDCTSSGRSKKERKKMRKSDQMVTKVRSDLFLDERVLQGLINADALGWVQHQCAIY